MNFYIVKLVFSIDSIAFCGVSSTFEGCMKILRQVFPSPTNLEQVTFSPNGLMYRWKGHPRIYVHIDIRNSEYFSGDTAYVITKRNQHNMTECMYAIFDNEQKAREFIERHVDDPTYTSRGKCKITEVDGYKPFARIIGDENPELNRVHFTIYESEVEK